MITSDSPNLCCLNLAVYKFVWVNPPLGSQKLSKIQLWNLQHILDAYHRGGSSGGGHLSRRLPEGGAFEAV